MLLESGVREIVLTGINTALYGTEKGFEDTLTEEQRAKGLTPMEMLLERLDSVEMPDGEDFRVRLSSLEPTVVDKDHVEKIIRYRRLCHHLHLSAQNGSNKILKSMNRHYTREEYLDIVRAIREFDPEYGITTDIIVGFSGEDEGDFKETMDLVREAGFGKTHIFRYSVRKGTVGEKLPDVIPGEVKNNRADRLEKVAEETADAFRRSNFGKTHIVLAEEEQDGYITGYTGNYIKVYIEPEDKTSGKSPRLGEFCRVQLTQIFLDGCKAVVVK